MREVVRALDVALAAAQRRVVGVRGKERGQLVRAAHDLGHAVEVEHDAAPVLEAEVLLEAQEHKLDHLDLEGAVAHRGHPLVGRARRQLVGLHEVHVGHAAVALALRHVLRARHVRVVVEAQHDDGRAERERALDGVDELALHEGVPRRDVVALHELDLAVDKDDVGAPGQRGGERARDARLEDLDPACIDGHRWAQQARVVLEQKLLFFLAFARLCAVREFI